MSFNSSNLYLISISFISIISYESTIYFNILFYSIVLVISSYLSMLFLPLLSTLLLWPMLNTYNISNTIHQVEYYYVSLLLFIFLEILLFIAYFWYYLHNYSYSYYPLNSHILLSSTLYFISGLILSLLSINLSITLLSLFIILTSNEYSNTLDLMYINDNPLVVVQLTIVFLHLLHLVVGIILILSELSYPHYYHFIEVIWLLIGYTIYLNFSTNPLTGNGDTKQPLYLKLLFGIFHNSKSHIEQSDKHSNELTLLRKDIKSLTTYITSLQDQLTTQSIEITSLHNRLTIQSTQLSELEELATNNTPNPNQVTHTINLSLPILPLTHKLHIILTGLSHLRYYYVSINLNYFYNVGFLLGTSIFLQTLSGLLLTLIYYSQLTLYTNIYIITNDFYYVYLYRNIHILLATIINILLLIHIFKGLIYTNLSNQLYTHYSGYILYILLIMISYLGYILTYGQLSYWGATVIINLLPPNLATLILGSYNISPVTINRYLFFHIILTLILYVFLIIHIFYLHQLSSQSVLPISISSSPSNQLSITFQHYILKDISTLIMLMTIFITISLFITLNLSHSNNLMPINPLSTPLHIIPEWYFLYLYSILKIIPSKLGGILTVLITILSILLITTSQSSYNVSNTSHISITNTYQTDNIILILITYIYLSYIGLQLPIAPYLITLRTYLLYLPLPIILLTLLNNIPSLIKCNSTITSSSPVNYISLISTTNHKRIGLYYLLIGSYIAILGIILSIIIRLELYSSSNTIINISNISFYNYTISNHGLLMLLFIVMPIVFGSYGNYLLVLTCGIVDIIFPRINNIGYLILLVSYLLIQYSIFTEYLTGSGWTLYPPLSTITSTYIISTMYLALSLSGISSLLTSINYLLLIPYLLHITDLLLISFLITSLMVLYTIPILAGGFLLATSDILLSTTYFSSYGDPILFQHLFWFFGQ